MNRQFVDKLNASESTRRLVSARFPEEVIELSTAVTILEASDTNPIGWSFRRLLQRRGNVVITDKRVVVQSSFRSPMTVLWTIAFLFATYEVISDISWEWILLALTAAILVLQRRPCRRNLPFSDLKSIRFGSVRGASGHGDIIALNLGNRALHLVTSQFVPDDLKRKMESRIYTDGED
jgi:hypothetical protein